MLISLLQAFCVLSLLSVPQDRGQEIYAKVAGSVFLLTVEDPKGESVGVGSAFLIRDQLLVTNAHVVRAGKPVLVTGPVKIDCEIIARDDVNDLALLRVSGTITAPALNLADTLPAAGATIYVIGNPQGLERTITQGLLTGTRKLDDRDLLQISAAVSPGSSGGPVVNEAGDVVGVTVGGLKDAQNLNFAVPVSALRQLLSGQTARPTDVTTILSTVTQLYATKLPFSTEEGSPWQLRSKQVDALYVKAIEVGKDSVADLLLISKKASGARSVEAARRALAISKRPSDDVLFALAEALYGQALWQSDHALTATLLNEAEQTALKALAPNLHPSADQLLILARIQESVPNNTKASAAYNTYERALRASGANANSEEILRGLFQASCAIKNLDNAKSWLGALEKDGKANAYDYVMLAELLNEKGYGNEAGDAFAKAALLGGTWDESVGRLWGRAGENYWYAQQLDKALGALRVCIEKGASEEHSETTTASCHRIAGLILIDRGVYDQALSHARQAVALEGDNGSNHYALAKVLNALQRFSEAEAAAKTAIRLTDGRYATFHFELGSALFEQKRWPEAQLAYEQAAKLAPTDPAPAYNVAVCLYNQHFYTEALPWYEEVLRRDPKFKDREEVLAMIQRLRAIR